jgi:hypothetical protein
MKKHKFKKIKGKKTNEEKHYLSIFTKDVEKTFL